MQARRLGLPPGLPRGCLLFGEHVLQHVAERALRLGHRSARVRLAEAAPLGRGQQTGGPGGRRPQLDRCLCSGTCVMSALLRSGLRRGRSHDHRCVTEQHGRATGGGITTCRQTAITGSAPASRAVGPKRPASDDAMRTGGALGVAGRPAEGDGTVMDAAAGLGEVRENASPVQTADGGGRDRAVRRVTSARGRSTPAWFGGERPLGRSSPPSSSSSPDPRDRVHDHCDRVCQRTHPQAVRDCGHGHLPTE